MKTFSCGYSAVSRASWEDGPISPHRRLQPGKIAPCGFHWLLRSSNIKIPALFNHILSALILVCFNVCYIIWLAKCSHKKLVTGQTVSIWIRSRLNWDLIQIKSVCALISMALSAWYGFRLSYAIIQNSAHNHSLVFSATGGLHLFISC